MAARLPRARFLMNVQLAYAREVHSLAGGHFLLKLTDGSETQIGRNYVKNFRTHFG
jgi:hypothetical protein